MYKFQLYKNTGRGIYIGAIDAITKAYIRKNEVFADAFNYFMYDGAQVIQPECLKELDPTEIAILLNEKDTMDKKAVKAEVQQKYRDILKRKIQIISLSVMLSLYQDFIRMID